MGGYTDHHLAMHTILPRHLKLFKVFAGPVTVRRRRTPKKSPTRKTNKSDGVPARLLSGICACAGEGNAGDTS
jgi:hypothetical protein